MSDAPRNPYAKQGQASAPTSNPYKRKKPPTTDNNNGGKRSSVPLLPPPAAATFSQAFSSLEETPHYQNQIVGTVTVNPQLEQEKAEQRALDLQEATNAVGVGAEDRDHHVLLQPHVLYVSTKQRGNNVLKFIRNVPFAFSKMVPDYIMSTTTCALFLSIKYHQLYNNYIIRRIGELKTLFRLRILLVLVDVEDNAAVLEYLNRLAVTSNMTLILAWSEQEAARYLETYKALDGKDASSIQKRESNNFQDQNADFMTACKPVNKTDASNLLTHFSTINAVAAASQDELALCEGLGPIKVKKLFEALHKPFSKIRTRERKEAKEGKQKLETIEDFSVGNENTLGNEEKEPSVQEDKELSGS
jgi:DNA excision repair protein ERCC-1